MHTVFLALGTNVGDRKKYLEEAIALLHKHVTNIISSSVYETKPVGYDRQDNFYNMVIKGQTQLTPQAVLKFIKSIEKKLGRIQRFRNGPREIDIDILLYDDLIFHSENLIIPHPRMHERDFVLQPLVDVDPDIFHPVYKKNAQELLKKLPKQKKAILSILQKISFRG